MTFLFGTTVFAADVGASATARDVESSTMFRETTRRSRLLFGFESSSLALEGRSLAGSGPRIGLTHGLQPKWALTASISQAFGGQGSASIYSGLAAEGQYALTGSFWSTDESLSSMGRDVYGFQSQASSIWSLGLGVQQLYLNGTQFVFPAPGFSASLGYSSTFWSVPLMFSFRTTRLTYQAKDVSAFFLNVDWVFSL